MKKIFLSAWVIVICLVSCQSKSAFDYSQNFVAKERALIPDINTTETAVAAFIADKKFDSVAVIGANMEQKVEAVINEITKNPAPDAKDGERFKMAVIKYFEYMKSIYTSYKTYGSANNETERNDAITAMQAIVNNKEKVAIDIKKAQQSFASLNGFKIEQ